MFDNIGGKLKALAKVECWVGIVIFGLVGLVEMLGSFLSGLLTIGLGVLLSWTGSFLTYGVGEAVEVGQENNRYLKALAQSMETGRHAESSGSGFAAPAEGKQLNDSMPQTSDYVHRTGWTCKQCGTKNSSIALICRECGRGQ